MLVQPTEEPATERARFREDARVVRLRDVQENDFPIFFEQQADPVANRMAAFTADDPTDRQAFMVLWHRIVRDDAVTKRTIVVDDRVAGNIVSFDQYGKPSVGYWIGREFWGRGIATRALGEFLSIVTTRPLYARAAKDNAASLRVLQKCGFTIYGEDEGYASARGEDVEEFILELNANRST